MTNTLSANNRLPWLDVIRMLAMIMVIGVHCIDPFYISPTLGQIPEYRHWAAVYGSLLRPSVPLFVMMTGLLLLPVREMKPGAFYRKRIFRVLWPFLIWSVLYNMFPWFTGVLGLPKEIIGTFFCYVQGNESQSLMDSLKDVAMIPFNFSFKENHMWYIYLLIGLFYYFAGFSGYLLLGHYLKGGNSWSIGKTLLVSVLLFAAGYAVTYTGFSAAAADPASTEPEMELFFTFCSPNVAMMTAAVFILMQKIRISNGKICSILANLTKCGFGIYMVHYFLVGPAFILIGKAGLPIPLQVPVMAAAIFLVSWGFTWLMYRIFGEKARYVMG